jgi:DNA-binding transcriptional LysR family regulator
MDSSTLRRAAVFHAVGLAGGITAAGQRIGKSPPAVHADLRRFEREVGIRLTERVGRSLRLTPKGREIFDVVGRALSDIDRACADIGSDAPVVSPLRLGAVTGFGRYRLVPALLPRLPLEQRLVLRTDSQDVLLDALGRGEIDLALTYRPVVAAPFESLAVADEELVLVGAAGTAAAAAGRLPFVTYDEYEYVFGRWFAEIVGSQPPFLRRHDHFEELEEALASVAAGRGATIAPADACRAFGLETAAPACRNGIFLCGSRAALRTPEARLIAACLEQPG